MDPICNEQVGPSVFNSQNEANLARSFISMNANITKGHINALTINIK